MDPTGQLRGVRTPGQPGQLRRWLCSCPFQISEYASEIRVNTAETVLYVAGSAQCTDRSATVVSKKLQL